MTSFGKPPPADLDLFAVEPFTDGESVPPGRSSPAGKSGDGESGPTTFAKSGAVLSPGEGGGVRSAASNLQGDVAHTLRGLLKQKQVRPAHDPADRAGVAPLALSCSLSCTLLHSRTLSHSLALACSLSLSLALSRSFTHSLSLSLSLALCRSARTVEA
jgi:hypothetical protein